MRSRWRHSLIFKARGVTTLALFLALCAGAGWRADPPNEIAPSEALRAVVNELVAEAEAIIEENEIPKGKPDYAARCSHNVTPEEIGFALTQRTHREPFVDAYIRWQLTSFDADLPAMDERAFVKFMDQAPRMLENPRAGDAVVAFFEQVNDAGKLKPSELEQVKATYLELEKRTKLAELRNRPAVEFREHVAEKLGAAGVNARLWLLEECAATVQAGWSTRSVKTRISKSFLAAANEADMPREHLRLIAMQTEKLRDLSRRFVNEITVLADGTVTVSFSKAAVTEVDIDKWINRLAGVP